MAAGSVHENLSAAVQGVASRRQVYARECGAHRPDTVHGRPASCQPAAAVTPQVRAEERSAAKAALSQAISRTKQQLGAKYEQELFEVQTDAESQTELQ